MKDLKGLIDTCNYMTSTAIEAYQHGKKGDTAKILCDLGRYLTAHVPAKTDPTKHTEPSTIELVNFCMAVLTSGAKEVIEKYGDDVPPKLRQLANEILTAFPNNGQPVKETNDDDDRGKE